MLLCYRSSADSSIQPNTLQQQQNITSANQPNPAIGLHGVNVTPIPSANVHQVANVNLASASFQGVAVPPDQQQLINPQGQIGLMSQVRPTSVQDSQGASVVTTSNVQSQGQVPAVWHFSMNQFLHLVSHAQSGALNHLSPEEIQTLLSKEIPHTDIQTASGSQISSQNVPTAVQQVSTIATAVQPDQSQIVQSVQPTENLTLITAEDVQHLFDLFQCGNLGALTVSQLQQLDFQIQCGNFGHLSPEKLQPLHIVAQALNLSRSSGSQAPNTQVQQPQQFDLSNLSADQIQNLQAQAQSVANISSGQDVSSTHSDPNLWKVVFKRSDGSEKEFMVNDQNGQNVSNYCQQVDISGQGANTSSAFLPPGTFQPFPAHTLCHVDPAQLHLYQRSQHSDTSSSLASGAPSYVSGGSVGAQTSVSGSGTTRYNFCI